MSQGNVSINMGRVAARRSTSGGTLDRLEIHEPELDREVKQSPCFRYLIEKRRILDVLTGFALWTTIDILSFPQKLWGWVSCSSGCSILGWLCNNKLTIFSNLVALSMSLYSVAGPFLIISLVTLGAYDHILPGTGTTQLTDPANWQKDSLNLPLSIGCLIYGLLVSARSSQMMNGPFAAYYLKQACDSTRNRAALFAIWLLFGVPAAMIQFVVALQAFSILGKWSGIIGLLNLLIYSLTRALGVYDLFVALIDGSFRRDNYLQEIVCSKLTPEEVDEVVKLFQQEEKEKLTFVTEKYFLNGKELTRQEAADARNANKTHKVIDIKNQFVTESGHIISAQASYKIMQRRIEILHDFAQKQKGAHCLWKQACWAALVSATVLLAFSFPAYTGLIAVMAVFLHETSLSQAVDHYCKVFSWYVSSLSSIFYFKNVLRFPLLKAKLKRLQGYREKDEMVMYVDGKSWCDMLRFGNKQDESTADASSMGVFLLGYSTINKMNPATTLRQHIFNLIIMCLMGGIASLSGASLVNLSSYLTEKYLDPEKEQTYFHEAETEVEIIIKMLLRNHDTIPREKFSLFGGEEAEDAYAALEEDDENVGRPRRNSYMRTGSIINA